MLLFKSPSDLLERLAVIIWKALFLYISLVPFYYLQPVQLAFNFSTITVLKYLPVLLFCGCVCVLVIQKIACSSFFIGIPLHRQIAGYLLICLLSLFGAEYILVGFFKLSYFSFTGICMPYVIINQFKLKKDVVAFVQWIVGIATVVACYGIFTYLIGLDYIWGSVYSAHNPYYTGIERAASTLGNALYVGSYLALCLPYGFWAFFSAKSHWMKRFYFTCCILILVGLSVTFARGGWGAAGVGATIFLWSRKERLFGFLSDKLGTRVIMTSVLFSLLLLPILENIGFQRTIHRTEEQFWARIEKFSNMSEAESFRFAQYGTTWRIIEESPILGIGFGNFTRLFEKYKHSATPKGHGATTTDNMYLMVFSEICILGMGFFLYMFGSFLLIFFREYNRAQAGFDRDFLLAAFASVCGFVVNMSTWDALNQPTVRMTFWILIGLAFCQIRFMLKDCIRNC
jgi:putative inorganic carbon (hco3(-)) transporter